MAHVSLTLDLSAFDAALRDVAAQFSDPILQVVYRLVCSPQVFPQLFHFQLDRLATPGTRDQQGILLHPTDGYRNLVLALRALEGEDLIIEKAGHP